MEPAAAIAVAVTSVIGTVLTMTPSSSISMLFVVATNCRPFAAALNNSRWSVNYTQFSTYYNQCVKQCNTLATRKRGRLTHALWLARKFRGLSNEDIARVVRNA